MSSGIDSASLIGYWPAGIVHPLRPALAVPTPDRAGRFSFRRRLGISSEPILSDRRTRRVALASALDRLGTHSRHDAPKQWTAFCFAGSAALFTVWCRSQG